MRIPRSRIDAYSRALNAVTERMRPQLAQLLEEQVDWTADVATVREQVIAIMQAVCGASSDVAARIAAEFYDDLRAEFGIDDGFSAYVDSGRDPDATEGAVRAFVDDLLEGRRDAFVAKCVDRADAETRRAANTCTVSNARRDPKRPRYARVPTGAETCRFCIMLASRGFAYHSEELASHAHANCVCRVIPSWDKSPAAESYDPSYYFDVYRNPDDHPEVTDAINARRRELRALKADA